MAPCKGIQQGVRAVVTCTCACLLFACVHVSITCKGETASEALVLPTASSSRGGSSGSSHRQRIRRGPCAGPSMVMLASFSSRWSGSSTMPMLPDPPATVWQLSRERHRCPREEVVLLLGDGHLGGCSIPWEAWKANPSKRFVCPSTR